MTDFQNILVVGGASGIGKATIAKLLPENYNVIVADSNKEKLNAINEEQCNSISIQ